MQQVDTIPHYMIQLQRELGLADNAEFLKLLGLDIPTHEYAAVVNGNAAAGEKLWSFFEFVMPYTLATPEELYAAWKNTGSLQGAPVIELDLEAEAMRQKAAIARKSITANIGYTFPELYPHIPAEMQEEIPPVEKPRTAPVVAKQKKTDETGTEKKVNWRDLAKEAVATMPEQTIKISPEELQRFAAALSDIMNARNIDGKVVFGEIARILRLTQDECLLAFGQAAQDGESIFNAEVAGGVGKTTLSVILASAAKATGMRTLIVVPSKLAVDGTYNEFKALRPDISVGRIYFGSHQTTEDVVVATYASLAKEFHRFYLDKKNGVASQALDLSQFRLALADEGHGYITKLSDRIFKSLISLIIAYSATHYYRSDKQLEMNFGRTAYKLPFLESVKRGDIAPEEWRRVVADVDMDMIALRNEMQHTGDFSAAGQRILNNSGWNDVLVSLYLNYIDAKGRRLFGEKTFVMCGGTDHANEVARLFNEKLTPLLQVPEFRDLLKKRGIDPDKVKHFAMPMHRKMEKDAPEDILAAYERDEILVLVSVKLLIQSVDSPRTSGILNGSPIFSLPFAGQRGLRGSRMVPPELQWFKDRFVVLDVVPRNAVEGLYRSILFAHYAYDAVGIVAGKVQKPVIECHEQPPIDGVLRIDTEWDPYDIQVLEKVTGPAKGQIGKTKEDFVNEGFVRIDVIGSLVEKGVFVAPSATWVAGHLTILIRENQQGYGKFMLQLTHGEIECCVDLFNAKEVIYVRAEQAKAYLEKILARKDEGNLLAEDVLNDAINELGAKSARYTLMQEFTRKAYAAIDASGLVGYGPVEIQTKYGLLKGRVTGKKWDERVLHLDPVSGPELARNFVRSIEPPQKRWQQQISRNNNLPAAAVVDRFIKVEQTTQIFDAALYSSTNALIFTTHLIIMADRYAPKLPGNFTIPFTNGEIDCRVEVTAKGNIIMVNSTDVRSYMMDALRESPHNLSATDVVGALVAERAITEVNGHPHELERTVYKLLNEHGFVGLGRFNAETAFGTLNVKVELKGENDRRGLAFEAESGKQLARNILVPQLRLVEDEIPDAGTAGNDMVRINKLSELIDNSRYRLSRSIEHVAELAKSQRPAGADEFVIVTTNAAIPCSYKKDAKGKEALYVDTAKALEYIHCILPIKAEPLFRAEDVINSLFPNAYSALGKSRFRMMGMLDDLTLREMEKNNFSGYGPFEADTQYGLLKVRLLIGTRGERNICYDKENAHDLACNMLTGGKIIKRLTVLASGELKKPDEQKPESAFVA